MKNCPSLECKAAAPIQRPLNDTEIKAIGKDWAAQAMTCIACDCVYTVEPNGDKVIRKP